MANASDEFRLASSSIDHEGRLPRKYTQDGQGSLRNISPPLEWYNVPDGMKTLALVVEDVDAPDPSSPIMPWTCWVVVNIPPTLKGLPEGFSGKEESSMGSDYAGIKEGNNDHKVPGWRGPKVPSPGHRFEFKLYALDAEVHIGNKVTKEKLLESIQGHVVGEALLMAKFCNCHHRYEAKLNRCCYVFYAIVTIMLEYLPFHNWYLAYVAGSFYKE